MEKILVDKTIYRLQYEMWSTNSRMIHVSFKKKLFRLCLLTVTAWFCMWKLKFEIIKRIIFCIKIFYSKLFLVQHKCFNFRYSLYICTSFKNIEGCLLVLKIVRVGLADWTPSACSEKKQFQLKKNNCGQCCGSESTGPTCFWAIRIH